MKKNDTEIRKSAEMIRKSILRKNRYDREIWQAILGLIEKSDYGKKQAEVNLVVPLPPGKNPIEEMMDGGFDGIIMQVLDIIQTIFQNMGNVAVAPYSMGLATRSATLSFTPR